MRGFLFLLCSLFACGASASEPQAAGMHRPPALTWARHDGLPAAQSVHAVFVIGQAQGRDARRVICQRIWSNPGQQGGWLCHQPADPQSRRSKLPGELPAAFNI